MSIVTAVEIVLAFVFALNALLWMRDRYKAAKKKPAAPLPKPSPVEIKLMGFSSPDDAMVSISKRDINALKLAIWRSREGWDIAWRQAEDIIGRCQHLPHCPGETSETEPCEPDCPDRQFRLSALVILNAARRFAPIEARKLVNAPYFAPSRERYSELLSELAAAQAMLDDSKAKPPPNEPLAEGPPQPKFELPPELAEEFAKQEENRQ